MLYRSLVLIILCLFPILAAAQKQTFTLSHPLRFGTERMVLKPNTFDGIADSVKIVAILVQFQEDNSSLTTGNGEFDLSNKYFNPATQRDTVIDSPPYDSAYFADHLLFLKNYYSKSSKGQLNISYDLFGQVITLPKKMEEYSPINNEPLNKLGDLYKDAWTAADAFINFNGYDPSSTAFVIFHAGTGRDVDVSSLIGFDPTPFDLPSVFLGLNNLKEFFGASYNGYQTSEGLFIQNSLVIPSTELRELDLISGRFLVELGMNGILTASFGSYLGLPDLFNTNTGKTAIGRFGLMDGQSLFSFNGIFPPEPSAWEKTYLGWINPIVISSGNAQYKLKTSSTASASDSTMYKVLISSQEYFLLENRNRDPENDGQKIYTRNRNFNDSSIYTSDQEGFQFFDISKIDGNVTDVQTLDWSLPGQISSTEYYKGGILIWHIDENVINANLSSNTINNNINHQGVDLKEAKGAQTIGVTFSTPFGEVTGDGTPVDYWYRGDHQVPAVVYKNEFTPASTPNSLSYSLANNEIYITDFDSIAPEMNFRVRIGGSIQPISGFPKLLGSSLNSHAIGFDFTGDASDEIIVNNGTDVYAFNYSGTPVTGSGLLTTGYGKYLPAFISSGSNRYLTSLSDTSIVFLSESLIQTSRLFTSGSSSTHPLVLDNTDFVYVGKNNGNIDKYRIDLSELNSLSLPGSINALSALNNDTFTVANGLYKFITIGNILSPASIDTVKVDTLGSIYINNNRLVLSYANANTRHSPILTDLNRDGMQDIVLILQEKLYAITGNGIVLDNFPYSKPVSSGVSAADINGDNIFELIFVTKEGDLTAYGSNGKIIGGFPVKVGGNTTSTPAILNLNDTLGISVISNDGYLYAFKTSFNYDGSKVIWKNHLKDQYHSNNNFVGQSINKSFSSKLPEERSYNWPNPVYDNKTFIRYYLNGNATAAEIKITDLSGELVTILKGTAFSNTDNEVMWDVSSVQSGIYYGIIEAEIDGTTERRVIKIAVVK